MGICKRVVLVTALIAWLGPSVGCDDARGAAASSVQEGAGANRDVSVDMPAPDNAASETGRGGDDLQASDMDRDDGGLAGELRAGPTAPSQPALEDDADAGAPVDDGMPTFSNLYEYVFTSCRVGICHGGSTSRILDMTTRDLAYAALVNQPALPMGPCAALGKLRVQPSAPDASLLYLKLMTTAPCGQQMPVGGGLSEGQRARVRDWIAAGAPDN